MAVGGKIPFSLSLAESDRVFLTQRPPAVPRRVRPDPLHVTQPRACGRGYPLEFVVFLSSGKSPEVELLGHV